MNMTEKDPLVSNIGKTTSMWKHFGFKESDEEQLHLLCKICYMVICALQDSATNLFTHLKLYHKVYNLVPTNYNQL